MPVVSHIIVRDGAGWIDRKPHVKAEMVARMVVDGQASVEATAAQYGLTIAEVHAALAYYYDNQAALDAAYHATLAEIRENAMTLDKLKAKIAQRRSGGLAGE